MMKKNRMALACAVLGLLFVGSVARAEPSAADRATARALAEEGGEALDRKDYKVAADRFARADALVHAPTLSLALARSLAGLGKYVEAQDRYIRIVHEGVAPGSPPAFLAAYHSAEKELKSIGSKLGWVTLTVNGPKSYSVTIDGTEVPKAALGVKRAVNPGEHLVKATADGFAPRETSFEVHEGDSASVSLTLDRLPGQELAHPAGATQIPSRSDHESSPALENQSGTSGAAITVGSSGVPSAGAASEAPRHGSAMKTIGIIGLGAGGAGIVVGSVAGLVAISRHGELQSRCDNGRCQPSEQGTLDGYRSASTIATVGFIAGAACAVGGLALVLAAPSGDRGGATTVTPVVGLGTLGARVMFP